MEGLAASMAQPQQAQPAGAMPSVDEIIALLMEGVPPEELEQMGVPRELIMEAISVLEQQMAAQQQQAPAPQMGGGLAQQAIGG